MKNNLLLCFLAALIFSSCSQKPSRTVVDLGAAEWRFSKERTSEILIDKSDLKIQYHGNDIEITFDSPVESFKELEVLFGAGIEKCKCVIESSNDGFETDIQSEYASKKPETTAKKFRSEVSEIDGTVGYVKNIEYAYLSSFVKSENKSWRVRITSPVDENKQPITAEIKGISLISAEPFDKAAVTTLSFDDSAWEITGLPHCYNDMDSYLNISDAESYIWQGDGWYRRRLTLPESYKNKSILLEFQAVSVGATLYVNGIAVEGKTEVGQPEEVTHIGCALPFVVDITKYVDFEKENILAVRVSNAPNSFYTYPEFGVYTGFGMGFGGIVAPVYMYVMDKVHVAPNVYSADGTWGTYVGTIAADSASATIRADVQVCNDEIKEVSGQLITNIIDPCGVVVATNEENFTLAADEKGVIEHRFTVENPELWFPNNSKYGKPVLYTLENNIVINDKKVDISTTKFGIRTITWDDDYCYVNGKKHFLQGFGNRNTYPALGAAVPAEILWRDIKYIADCGGNALRVGHIPATTETLKACDVYGIMVLQNSGDNEWTIQGEPLNTYKKEYDRQSIISGRNHPSIIVWESNNGLARGEDVYTPDNTLRIAKEYDYIAPRLIHNRDGYPPYNWDSTERIMVGYTNRYTKVEGSPTLNTEVYSAVWNGDSSHCIARFDYENEKQFAAWYVEDYYDDIKNRACGWLDWMLAETQGEGYTIYLNGVALQKSLGSCAMDGNRFEKLKYRIHKNAMWIDYDTKPGVTLQTNWNVEGVVDIDAWSNCPYVGLFVGEKSYGIVEPDDRLRCTWRGVESSTEPLKVVGYSKAKEPVCEDIRLRAGEPYAVELSVEEPITHPDGTVFKARANGSDVELVTAKVVDKDGNLCTLSDNVLEFMVEGEGIYKGSYNFYVAEGEDLFYHAPGDKELQAEGGMMKIAIRSTLNKGEVKVTVASKGLKGNTLKYKTL